MIHTRAAPVTTALRARIRSGGGASGGIKLDRRTGLEVRWDGRLVRISTVRHPWLCTLACGEWVRRPGEQHQEPRSSQRGYVGKLIGTCARVGPDLKEWGEAAYVGPAGARGTASPCPCSVRERPPTWANSSVGQGVPTPM
jgi:hypothetical protein